MQIVDAYYNDGVSVKLIKDKDNYQLVRKDGKYSYVKPLGNVSRDEAQSAFARMCL